MFDAREEIVLIYGPIEGTVRVNNEE